MALGDALAAFVRLWVQDHLLAPHSAEHRVVAMALTALILGSALLLLFLLASGRGCGLSRFTLKRCPAIAAPVSAAAQPGCRAPELGRQVRRRRVNRKATERREPYLQKFMRATQSPGATSVDMQRQRLTQCPEQLGFAGYNIVVVNLSHNALETIPESFVCLQGLRELRLDFNRLRSLPIELESLPHLELLSLAHNAFSKYPICVFGIAQLKALDLSHNRLTDFLTSSGGSFAQLEQLWLAFNHLSFLTDPLVCLPALRELDLSHNRLECLPHDWSGVGRLEQLDLSHNCLHSVTSRLHLCAALQVLRLSNNKIRQLPSSLFSLFNLACLDVSHNRLLFLPKAVLNVLCAAEFSATGNPWLEHDLEPSSWTIASDAVFGPQLQDLRFARCCRSEWLERPKSPLSLLEAAAAVLVEQGQWTEESLPACLHEFLLTVDRCMFCSTPVFPPKCCRSVGFFKDSRTWLPFSDVTCPTLEAL